MKRESGFSMEMNTTPNAILFDLDDTLISFEGVSGPAWEKCCNDFIQNHTLQISIHDFLTKLNKIRKWYWSDSKRHKVGRENLRNARREIVKLTLKEFSITDDELSNELADNYSAYQNSLICLFPSTFDTLNNLKARGIHLGLITNGTSEGQRAKLNRFNLTGFFDVVLIDQEVGFGKPDIRIYELALNYLKLSHTDVWMVGDNLIWDIQSPQSLGIYSVWHDYKRAGLPKETSVIPDLTIRDLSELLPNLNR